MAYKRTNYCMYRTCQLEYCQNCKLLQHMLTVPHANLVRGCKERFWRFTKRPDQPKTEFQPLNHVIFRRFFLFFIIAQNKREFPHINKRTILC